MESIIKTDDKYAVVFKVNLLRATLNEAKDFKDYLDESIKETDKEIIVNLSECEHMDSTFLGVLVSGYKKLKKKNRNLMLIEPKTQSSIFLTLDSIGKIFPLYNNVEDALQDIENKKLLENELNTLDKPTDFVEEEIKEDSIVNSLPIEETIEMPSSDELEFQQIVRDKETELNKEFINPDAFIDNKPVEQDLTFEEKETDIHAEEISNLEVDRISFNEITSSHLPKEENYNSETLEMNTPPIPEEEKFRKGRIEWKFGFESVNS